MGTTIASHTGAGLPDVARHTALGAGLGAGLGVVGGGITGVAAWGLLSRSPGRLVPMLARGVATGAASGLVLGALLGSDLRTLPGEDRRETMRANLFVAGSGVAVAAAAPHLVQAAMLGGRGRVGEAARSLARAGAWGLAGFAGGATVGVLAVPAGIPQHFRLVERHAPSGA